MKEQGVIKKLFCVMSTCLLFAVLLQGCLTSGSGKSSVKASSPKTNSEELAQLDQQIATTKSLIEGYEKFQTDQLRQAAVNAREHDRSRGWAKLDGKPTYEEISNRSYDQAAATEKEIARLNKKLQQLEGQKSKLMNQSSGCFLPETLVQMEDGSLKPLAQLQPGQKVLTYDIGAERRVSRPVVKTYFVEANHLYTINKQLTATGGERLLSQDGWKKIRDLRQGEYIHIGGKMEEIESIDYVREDHTLYNIQVAGTHNFYVVTSNGATFLVHNSGGGGSK